MQDVEEKNYVRFASHGADLKGINGILHGM
jgi:hypothetical protein